MRVGYSKPNQAYVTLEDIYGDYTMQPGLINGRNYYTSDHESGKFAISWCGNSWYISPTEWNEESMVGRCTGYANTFKKDDCVHDITYHWDYYNHANEQYVRAHEGLSIWCLSRK